jgi:anhydro-N-acetylmuramic acid kinase
MTAETYIGLMSGTSVDSIDAAAVEFTNGQFKLLGSYSHSIPAQLKQSILALCHAENDSVQLYAETDHLLGELFADAALGLMAQLNLTSSKVAAIGSHGQTVRHAPPTPATIAYSQQIGDPNIIAMRTGCPVVADFRRADMALGGHGAPLVPAFHQQLFAHQSKTRVIVNIGGIANITLLPASESQAGEQCIGYDTGPGNMLLDSCAQIHLGTAYDNNGDWAASGTINSQLLHQLKSHPYFSQLGPKSTGRETFNQDWLDQQLRQNEQIASKDIQATLVQLTAESISDQINSLDLAVDEVFVCGGGAFNGALMTQLAAAIPASNVSSTETLGLDPSWVEACAFAWLAKQRIREEVGNLPAVTGASREAILGGLYLP